MLRGPVERYASKQMFDSYDLGNLQKLRLEQTKPKHWPTHHSNPVLDTTHVDLEEAGQWPVPQSGHLCKFSAFHLETSLPIEQTFKTSLLIVWNFHSFFLLSSGL